MFLKLTVENQRFEITPFCKFNNLIVNDWIEETISGTKSYTKRQLGDLLLLYKIARFILWNENK